MLRVVAERSAAYQSDRLRRRHVAEQSLERLLARLREQRRGGGVAEAEAGRMHPRRRVAIERDVVAARCARDRVAARLLNRRGQLAPAAVATGDVVTDMQHAPRTGGSRQQPIERCDAPRIRRRHAEPFADVDESAFADPPDARLQRLQRREQPVPLLADCASTVRDVRVAQAPALATVP